MSKKRDDGFTANPEYTNGMTLDAYANASDRAAARLRRAGVGATVRLTTHAIESNITVRGGHKVTTGVIVGWGDHKWMVRVRPHGRKTSSSYHVRFWEPVRRG